MWSFPLILSILCTLVHGVVVWPPPNQVTAAGNGFTFTASPRSGWDALTYKVYIWPKVYVPTVVYNCKHVPSLCGSAKLYMGGATSREFHYDSSDKRKDWRRDQTCPTRNPSTAHNGWIDRGGPLGIGNRCPEALQRGVLWKHKGNAAGLPLKMSRDANGVESIEWLAKDVYGFAPGDPAGSPQRWYEESVPVRLSCDEFPAASWIEGGPGAATYCAPYNDKPPNCKKIVQKYNTEQNWQSSAFRQLVTYIKLSTPSELWGNGIEDTVIFRFNFRMEDSNDGDAVWIESNGNKRYCYGPAPSGSYPGGPCARDRPGDVWPQ